MREPTTASTAPTMCPPGEIAGIPVLDLDRDERSVRIGSRILGAARAAAAIHQSQASRLIALRSELEPS